MIVFLLIMILGMLVIIASNTAPRDINWYVPPYEPPLPRRSFATENRDIAIVVGGVAAIAWGVVWLAAQFT